MKKHDIELRYKINKYIMIFNAKCGKKISNYHLYKIEGVCKICYNISSITKQLTINLIDFEIYIQQNKSDIKRAKEFIELIKDYIYYLDKKSYILVSHYGEDI